MILFLLLIFLGVLNLYSFNLPLDNFLRNKEIESFRKEKFPINFMISKDKIHKSISEDISLNMKNKNNKSSETEKKSIFLI
jgi:hypothetical protein